MSSGSRMKTAFRQPRHPWMPELTERCSVLLDTGDSLVTRYSKPRRRTGVSLATAPLYKVLEQLRRFGAVLSREDQKKVLLWEAALEERLLLLKQRRIPPTRQLRRLRSQCQELCRWLVQQQDPAVSLLDPDIPWDAPDVLVGTLRRPSQLDICLIHGFYHVPVCQIPQERLPIRYVAIYQSRSLFRDDCGIRFFGRVKRCIPVRRWEISEIPKSSDQLYYRLEVVRWEQLEEPIAVREVPFNHLFTNLFLLKNSRETPELYLKNEWEYRCYQTLKASLRQNSPVALRHPGGIVRLKNGFLRIYRRFRPIATYAAEDFHRTPLAIFTNIMKHLE